MVVTDPVMAKRALQSLTVSSTLWFILLGASPAGCMSPGNDWRRARQVDTKIGTQEPQRSGNGPSAGQQAPSPSEGTDPQPVTQASAALTKPTVAFIPLCVGSNSESEKKYTIEMAKQLAAAFAADPSMRVIEHRVVEEAAAKAKLAGFLVSSNKDIVALVNELTQKCDIVVMLGPNAGADSPGFQVSAAMVRQIVTSPRYWAIDRLLGPPRGDAKVRQQEVDEVSSLIKAVSDVLR